MTTPDVPELVEIALKKEGFDGLFSDDGECACLIGDIAPCGEIGHHCQAGYRREGCSPECGLGCSFHIMREKQ